MRGVLLHGDFPRFPLARRFGAKWVKSLGCKDSNPSFVDYVLTFTCFTILLKMPGISLSVRFLGKFISSSIQNRVGDTSRESGSFEGSFPSYKMQLLQSGCRSLPKRFL